MGLRDALTQKALDSVCAVLKHGRQEVFDHPVVSIVLENRKLLLRLDVKTVSLRVRTPLRRTRNPPKKIHDVVFSRPVRLKLMSCPGAPLPAHARVSAVLSVSTWRYGFDDSTRLNCGIFGLGPSQCLF